MLKKSPATLGQEVSARADKVIDYTKEDFTESGELYDLIFDAVGKSSQANCQKVLAPNGTYVTSSKGNATLKAESLVFLKELVEAGKIRSVIDRSYPFEQIPEAARARALSGVESIPTKN